jgi:Zinc-finger associated domain (zf-AD)
MDEIVKADVCLVCLTENMFGDMKSVFASQFEERDQKISYFEGYKLCSGVEPRSEQIFQSICSECEKNLKISFNFREQCRSSYDILLERSGLADVKSEVLSDTEDNGPVDFVYSEPTEPVNDEESKMYRHQVFVQMKSTGKVLVPVAQIKKEEKKPPVKERTPPEVRDPASFAVEVVLKEEQTPAAAAECSSGDDDDDFGGDQQMNDDSDSYDDDEDVKVDTKDKKSKSAKRRRESFEDENMDIFLLEGNFACPLCELVLDNFRDFKTHRKTHLWDSGLNFIKRVCELCNKHTDKYLYHIKYEHPDHKPNSCRQCDQSFNQPNQLHRHLLTHLEGKRFPCKGCNHKYCKLIIQQFSSS